MKNLKKVLALVMAFAMAFTMFAGAVDFSDVKPGDDYSAAISMLSDLEVVSGNGKGAYEPEKAVTRAEACVLIANMMNGGKADTARFAGGSNFSDVAKGWWGESAIAYCVQNGITYGVGGGKFAPNREITDAEFVAMMTRAMGYDTAANPLSFPYGNYTAAVNNGLLDNIPYVEGSDCTKGECAQIIYDALFADYARLTANLNVIHNADDHDVKATLIHDVFGLEKAHYENAKGNCVAHEWVITGVSCEDEDVIFVTLFNDGKTTEYSKKTTAIEMDCVADVESLIGYKVALWGEDTHSSSNNDGEVDTVLAVEVLEGQVAYEFNPTMDIEDDLGLDEDDWNDGAMMGYDGSIFEKNGNDYVLIDWDDNGEIDYIKATERYYAEVTSVTSKKVVIESGNKDFTLDLVDGEYKIHGVKHDYVVELNAEEGDIVEITVDDSYETTYTITIDAIDPVTKTFTKWNSKGEYYFDGEKMEAAGAHDFDWAKTAVSFIKGELKDDFYLYLNANGYIVYEELVGSESDGFLMILDSEDGTHKRTEEKSTKASIEAMLPDGEVVDFNLAFDADFASYDKDHYVFADEVNFVGGVYEYTLDDNGDIEELTAECDDWTFGTYSYAEQWNRLKVNNDNDKYYKYTGKEFTFMVEPAYVQAHKTDADDLYVDVDHVRALELSELPDIATTDTDNAQKGDYAGYALAFTKESDANDPDDIVKGAVMVVKSFDVLKEYTYIPALITYVTYDGDVYTFTGAAQGQYDDLVSVEADVMDDIASVAADADILEDLVDANDSVWESIGNGLWVEFKLNADGEIVNVELMIDGVANWTSTHYEVVRGALTEVDDANVELAWATADVLGTAIKAINYPNYDSITYDLDENEVEYYTIDQAPALNADAAVVAVDGFKAGLDGDIEADGTIVLSHYSKKATQDYYYFADLVLDEDGDVYAAFLFADEIDESDPQDIADAAAAKAELKAKFDKSVADYGTTLTAYNTAVTAAETAATNAKNAYDAFIASGAAADEAAWMSAQNAADLAAADLAAAKAAHNAAIAEYNKLVEGYNAAFGTSYTKVAEI